MRVSARLLALVLVVSLAIAALPVSGAADSLYIADDYESGIDPSWGMTIKEGGSAEIQSETVNGQVNHYLDLAMSWHEGMSVNDTLFQNSFMDFTQNMYVSFCIRATELKQGNLTVSLRQNGPAELGTLSLMNFSNGTVSYLNGFNTGVTETLEPSDTWTRFDIAFDLKNNTVTAYRDGEQKAQCSNARDVTEQTRKFNFPSAALRYQIFALREPGSRVSFQLDNLLLMQNDSLAPGLLIMDRKLYKNQIDPQSEIFYLQPGPLIATATVENQGTQSAAAAIGYAIYDGDAMTEFGIGDSVCLAAGERVQLEVDIAADDLKEGQTIKLFLVNNFYAAVPIARPMVYEESELMPLGSDIIQDLKAHSPDRAHPRLLINQDKAAQLKSDCVTKPKQPYKSWYDRIKREADSILNRDVCVYEDLDELRLQSAGSVGKYLMTLSFVYLMEGDAVYMERAVKEILNTAGMKLEKENGAYVKDPDSQWVDWNPKHFLDTSAICLGYALAYDWGYDYFSAPEHAQEAEILRQTLAERGLTCANNAYDKTPDVAPQSIYWWADTDNNWSMVCNGGAAVAALAIGDEPQYEQLCAAVLQKGLRAVVKCMENFAPDGAWYEGTGYWNYTVEYMCNYFGSLLSATGRDYSYLALPGISRTGFFPIAMMGTQNTTFNLNDASESTISTPEYFFLASFFDEPTLATYRYYQLTSLQQGATLKDLIWYDPDIVGNISSLATDMQTDFYFTGPEVATFRNRYFDKNGTFAGLHGGINGVNHGHIDAGSFIYEAQGVRWAVDLGGDAYNLYNFFGGGENDEKSRWSYYRNRGEGHNTIILNPDLYADQPITPEAQICNFAADESMGMAAVDMQPIYGEYTDSARRGMMLDKQSQGLLIRDELDFQASGGNELYWFMHFYVQNPANPAESYELSDDGRSVILKQNGKRLWVGILEGDETFTIMDARPLPTSPNPDTWEENMANDGSSTNPQKQNANESFKKLAIHNTDVGGAYRLTVYMVPLADGEDRPASLPDVTDIDTWFV